VTLELELIEWKRTIFELYADVRKAVDPHQAWHTWREARDDLFRNHPQSPLPIEKRDGFRGLDYFEYEPAYRTVARIDPAEPMRYEISTSGDGSYAFTRVAVAIFELKDETVRLELYWLDGYGGGLFLPFRDATAGLETYGAGRYLLDTVKGSDLGGTTDQLILDFNFSYNPSCAYDPAWVCPLAPPPNRVAVAIRAGERHSG
jgi:uncharacterized protein